MNVEVMVDGRAQEPWTETEWKQVRNDLRALVALSPERTVLRARFGIPIKGTGSLSAAAEQRFREAAHGVKVLTDVRYIQASFTVGRQTSRRKPKPQRQ